MIDDISSLLNHLKGLRAIWQILTATVPEVTGRERRISYMDFEEAFSLYSGYSTQGHDSSDLKNSRKRFKELLCHPQYGLCIYVVKNRFIVIKSSESDLELFFNQLLSSIQSQLRDSKLVICLWRNFSNVLTLNEIRKLSGFC